MSQPLNTARVSTTRIVQGFVAKPFATSQDLWRCRDPSELYFSLKIHLLPITFFWLVSGTSDPFDSGAMHVARIPWHFSTLNLQEPAQHSPVHLVQGQFGEGVLWLNGL